MTKRASPRTLLRRPLKASDFPFVICRRRWIDIATVLILPVLLAVSGFFFWLVMEEGQKLGWVAVWPTLIASLLLLGCYVGLDNIGYRLIVDRDGVTALGLIKTRHFSWNEISQFKTWRGRAVTDDGVISLGFYQTVVHVDGSDDPKRLARNLYFAGHFIPPMMELGGKELAALLGKAKRFAETLPD